MWPENWLAVELFCRLGTQWNIGMNGPTGLRYESLYPLLDRADVCTVEWNELFDDIGVLESAAMLAMQQP